MPQYMLICLWLTQKQTRFLLYCRKWVTMNLQLILTQFRIKSYTIPIRDGFDTKLTAELGEFIDNACMCPASFKRMTNSSYKENRPCGMGRDGLSNYFMNGRMVVIFECSPFLKWFGLSCLAPIHCYQNSFVIFESI